MRVRLFRLRNPGAVRLLCAEHKHVVGRGVDYHETPKQQGKLRNVLIGGGGGNDSNAQSINSWVVAHGKVINYGGGSSGLTLYDLSGAVS